MSKDFLEDGYELEDLYQIGAMGFVKAIKRFDTNFEVKLSTYAVPYILGEIKRYIRDDGMVKVSRSTKELVIKILEIQKEHMRKTGEEIGLAEIAKLLKVPKEEIALALDSLKPVESIYEESYSDGEGSISILDRLSSKNDEEAQIVNQISLREAIKGLEKDEQEIIMLRYYREKTQSQVAKILGLTQVQVSRLERKVLDKVRVKMGS